MTAASTERASVRLSLAWVAACASAVFLYAFLRIGQVVLLDEPNPASVIWSEHTGYYWRSLTATYLGGIVGFAVWLLAARHAAAIAEALKKAVPGAAVLLAVQALVVP